MTSSKLPRDYVARLSGKFMYESLEDKVNLYFPVSCHLPYLSIKETDFERAHEEAQELLAEVRPHYSQVRLLIHDYSC